MAEKNPVWSGLHPSGAETHSPHAALLPGNKRGRTSNPAGRVRKTNGLQHCKPYPFCIGLESGLQPAFNSLSTFKQRSRPYFIVVAVWGCPGGSCIFCMNFTNHGS